MIRSFSYKMLTTCVKYTFQTWPENATFWSSLIYKLTDCQKILYFG